MKSVAVYSDADRYTRPVLEADEKVRIGPPSASESYLSANAILEACLKTGAEAVHPGYGFLSENAAFAEMLRNAGIAFIGPRPEHLSVFGLKHTARQIAEKSGVPLLPGSGLLETFEEAAESAERIGYPIMLKSVAGGGGIGMQRCDSPAVLRERFEAVGRTAKSGFGDGRLYLERFIVEARHIEVQIFGDGKGRVIALGERDCSLQRRNQKVVEETPAPNISEAVRKRLHEAAITLAASVHYESAGTVEFIYDAASENFYFLEVNTRLQVEHPVTEAVYGIDLVEWMIRQAAGEDVLSGSASLTPKGAAIEVRVYAESPSANFRPSAGLLTDVAFPSGVRVDSWIETGTDVTAFYDPMLAKIIASGPGRAEAIAALRMALDQTAISGIETNLEYLKAIAQSDMLEAGKVSTAALGSLSFRPHNVEVLAPGAQSTIQELPGRLGFWDVGVPPSGPMDELSFRLANRVVGNPESTTALELTVRGPVLRFNSGCVVGLVGASMEGSLDGETVGNNVPIEIRAGQTLTLGAIRGPGQRTYLAVRGGFVIPEYLGSRATFTLGGFGGHSTGVLSAGDSLPLANALPNGLRDPCSLRPEEVPPLTASWTLGVVYGPQGSPDFFTAADIDTFFAAEYEVHFNSSRTGVRLIGSKPQWARRDGGEAGLHPSNLHDNAYAVGSIDFTGDMPIILGPDGPSLGGFVCPAVLARNEMWKLGQLKPGDKVRFQAVAREDDPVAGPTIISAGGRRESAILGQGDSGGVPVFYRRAGDDNILVEYGPMALDLGLRLRVHLLMNALKEARLPQLIDLTPGIRSLQIHYDGTALPRAHLLDILRELEMSLPTVDQIEVPSRIVHLPLSWNDPQTVLAMKKYQELVRPDAPWCPSNIEFIRRINGLQSEEDVHRIVFDASYFVLGLGDVYLGAPVATPIDPRHRLVTTKYNPARTWTPENAVGIGGAYMCIYGMEGPGGYQLFGRTIQVWNSWRETPVFEAGKPWLLRFFDQVRFFPVSADELLEARAAFPHGEYPLRIENAVFSYAGYKAMLHRDAAGIAAFKQRQQHAFNEERERWKSLPEVEIAEPPVPAFDEGEIPEGCVAITSEVPGNVWKINHAEGDAIAAGEAVVIIESMKMEISISSNRNARVRQIRVRPGQTVRAGQIICVAEIVE